ncbi:MAG: hypothetical protein KGL58_00610, partial [Pseudomonadota bacterium]|nr:hypothetical protein [Pseudomonadota bacterium]
LSQVTTLLVLTCAVAIPAQAAINSHTGLSSEPISDKNLQKVTGRGISIDFSTEPAHPVVLLWDELGHTNSTHHSIELKTGNDNSQTQELILSQPGGSK